MGNLSVYAKKKEKKTQETQYTLMKTNNKVDIVWRQMFCILLGFVITNSKCEPYFNWICSLDVEKQQLSWVVEYFFVYFHFIEISFLVDVQVWCEKIKLGQGSEAQHNDDARIRLLE